MLTQILIHTPPWVFVLFVGLLYLGYIQTKTRSMSKARVTLLPTVMIGFSLIGVWAAFGSVTGFISWSAGLAGALLLNRMARQPREVTYSDASRLFTVRGSWVPMMLILVIFFTRYTVSVALVMNDALRDVGIFVAAICFVYGLFSGTFLARAMQILSTAPKPRGA